MLADFTPAAIQQGDLFTDEQQVTRSEAQMQVIDKINQGRMGKVWLTLQELGRLLPFIPSQGG